MIATFSEARDACLQYGGFPAGSKESVIAEKALGFAVAEIMPAPFAASVSPGWLNAKEIAKRQRLEKSRVEREVKRKTRSAYGLTSMFAPLLMPILWALVSAVIGKVLQWLWDKWAPQPEFSESIRRIQTVE